MVSIVELNSETLEYYTIVGFKFSTIIFPFEYTTKIK